MSQPSDIITLKIDGRTCKVPKGTLLVNAAKTIGITVPVFCYHEKMKPVGACRMCLVEIEKMPKLQTACTTPVAEGMTVQTNSPRVIQAQRSVIEFLLANHPLDCPVCDKGGECPLQDNTFGWGDGVSRFEDIKRHFVKPLDLNDEIKLDRERCIMCFRCTRFAREIAGDESLTVLERGSVSEIGTAPGRTFDSPFSGNTIEICPVGALTSSRFRFRARIWDLKQVPSVCDKCPVGCNLKLQIRDDKVLRLWSRENLDVDDSWLCDRGRFTYEYINSPERLREPMIRVDGELRVVPWDEALEYTAERLRSVRERFGAQAIGAVASPRTTNEEAYLLQKFVRLIIGSNNVDHRLTPWPPVAPLPFDAATGSISELEKSSTILVLGADPINEQPVLDLRIKKAAGLGAKIVCVGPEETDLAKYGRWLRVPAGSLPAIVYALVQAVLAGGLAPEEIKAGRGEELSRLSGETERFIGDDVTAQLGITRDVITALAGQIAAGPCAILYRREGPRGASREAGEELARAVATLATLTNNLARTGAGLFPLALEANEQGMVDMGLGPQVLPGQQSVADDGARATLESFWGRSVPSEPGRFGHEMVAGGVRALYLIGHDAVAENPDAARRLSSLDLLIVQDVFMTETAKMADIVFPTVTFAEHDGTFTNMERRVQRLRSGLNHPGEPRPGWRIIRDLAVILGGDFDYARPQDIFAEITSAAPTYRGLTYERISRSGLQWPRQPSGAGTRNLVVQADQAPIEWPAKKADFWLTTSRERIDK